MGTTVDLSFHITNPQEIEMTGVPLRASVPMPEGAINDPARDLALVDEQGRAVKAQWKVLAPWADGSVRFVLIDYAVAKMAPGESRKFHLVDASRAKGKAPDSPSLDLKDTDDAVEIDTGRLRVTLSRKGSSLFEELYLDGKQLHVDQDRGDMIVEDTSGQLFRASQGEFSMTVEESGPIRAVILVEGKFGSRNGTFLNYRMRYHFVANCAHVLIVHTSRNRELPREGVDFCRISIESRLNLGPQNVRRIRHRASGKLKLQNDIEIPENVDIDMPPESYHPVLQNPRSLRQDPDEAGWSFVHRVAGTQWPSCADIIDLHDPELGGMSFQVQEPLMNRPVRLASDGQKFTIDLFPKEDEPFHFNQGMGKTRDIQLSFHGPELNATEAIDSAGLLSYPGVVGATAEWYRECKIADVHRTLVPQNRKYMLLEMKIETMLRGEPSLLWPNSFGWRDYGDEVTNRGRMLEWGIHQCGNNEEDYIHAIMLDSWRKGKPYGALANVRHLMDIDYIDFSTEPQRDGAACPHSVNHTDGEVYPSHQWCEGLLLFYLATGDTEALRISKRIGDNLCYWINGPYSNAVFFTDREAGWPLISLANLYDYTREQKYLDAAMEIVNELCSRYEKRGLKMFEYPAGSGRFISYNVAWLFDGVWQVYRATNDGKVLEFWKNITRPAINSLERPDGHGYISFRPFPFADLTVLDHYYELTGDEHYVKLGENGLRLTLTSSPDKDNMFQLFGANSYRHYIFFLKLADEFGMIDDKMVTFIW